MTCRCKKKICNNCSGKKYKFLAHSRCYANCKCEHSETIRLSTNVDGKPIHHPSPPIHKHPCTNSPPTPPEILETVLAVFNESDSGVSDKELREAIKMIMAKVDKMKISWGFDIQDITIANKKKLAEIIMVNDLPNGRQSCGYHVPSDKDFPRPVGYVCRANCGDWIDSLSHEIFEFVVNPLVDRFSASLTLKDEDGNDVTGKFLQEVCDPIALDGNKVADFVYPSWYIPGSPCPWDAYNLCSKPLECLGSDSFAQFHSDAGPVYTWNGKFLQS